MPSKFLVVDDEHDMCNLVRMILERFLPGSIVLTAGGAAQAIEIARREKPDLALLDVKMPDVDGITLHEILLSQEFGRFPSPQRDCVTITKTRSKQDGGDGRAGRLAGKRPVKGTRRFPKI